MLNRDKNNISISKFDYIVLYLLFILTSGFHDLSGEKVLIGCIIISISILFKHIKQIKLNHEKILLLLFLFINVMLFFWVNGETVKQMLITLIFIFTSFIYTLAYRWELFKEIYVKLLVVISAVSLFFYLMTLAMPSSITLFPKVKNSIGIEAYFALLTFVKPNMDNLFRNQGIFWEPGAFQTFANIAILITIFNNKLTDKKKMLYISILYIALITTFSTTGYATGALILIAFFAEQLLSRTQRNRKKYKYLRYIFILTIVASLIYIKIPSGNKYLVFSKLTELANPSTNILSTTSVRVNAIKYTFIAFFNNPITGIGYTKLSELANNIGFMMFTNTPLNWFTIYGLFLGLLYNFGMVLFASSFSNKMVVKVILILMIVLSISTEEYSRNPSILIFSLYFYMEYFSDRSITKKRVRGIENV